MTTLPNYPMHRREDTRMTSKAKAAVLITAIITFGFVLMSFAPKADAAVLTQSSKGAAAYVIPRCEEDQVISRRGRCIDRDDSTTKYQRVSEAGWGYWVDTRHPKSRLMRPLVPACHRWQVVTRTAECVALRKADFRGGWWYRKAVSA